MATCAGEAPCEDVAPCAVLCVGVVLDVSEAPCMGVTGLCIGVAPCVGVVCRSANEFACGMKIIMTRLASELNQI